MNHLILNTAELRDAAPGLTAGDRVLLCGDIFTARDAAHKRLFELLDRGETPPFDIADACIYYAGPTPAKPGKPVGSCGPTTSGRMDRFTPRLLDMGLAATIGKGPRNAETIAAMRRNGATYFAATGGAGALIAGCVTNAREVAFADLGCESVKRLTVHRFPLIIAVDSQGRSAV